MKRYFLLFLIISLTIQLKSQEINGRIMSDSAGLTIIQLWGTHYERGYAHGWLAGKGMTDIYTEYLQPAFGDFLPIAKEWLEEGTNICVPDEYRVEAQAMIDGMNAAGTNIENLDYLDALICNSYIDFFGFMKLAKDFGPGCSALMSWGDAVEGTDIDGQSVISRHVDWDRIPSLLCNQAIVVHIPEETDEQPWALAGFKGQLSALSGFNNSGVAVFMHSLGDFYGNATTGNAYEPIWFSLRKALEHKDYNGDGVDNVEDVKSVLLENESGYPKASIVSCISSTINDNDSLIAMVAELTCEKPYHTFRTNDYDDRIPGDNLYAANSSIKRNDAHNYCSRYLNIIEHIGEGELIGAEENWSLLRDYSQAPTRNMQFMQYIPDESLFKISVADTNQYAYEKEPIVIHTDTLFQVPSSSLVEIIENQLFIFPNPAHNELNVHFISFDFTKLYIYDSNSRQLIIEDVTGEKQHLVNLSGFDNGIYILHLVGLNNSIFKYFVKY